jgi:hypothetical protein
VCARQTIAFTDYTDIQLISTSGQQNRISAYNYQTSRQQRFLPPRRVASYASRFQSCRIIAVILALIPPPGCSLPDDQHGRCLRMNELVVHNSCRSELPFACLCLTIDMGDDASQVASSLPYYMATETGLK